jgi:hypothetical protein
LGAPPNRFSEQKNHWEHLPIVFRDKKIIGDTSQSFFEVKKSLGAPPNRFSKQKNHWRHFPIIFRVKKIVRTHILKENRIKKEEYQREFLAWHFFSPKALKIRPKGTLSLVPHGHSEKSDALRADLLNHIRMGRNRKDFLPAHPELICLRRPRTFLKKGSWTSKNFSYTVSHRTVLHYGISQRMSSPFCRKSLTNFPYSLQLFQ